MNDSILSPRQREILQSLARWARPKLVKDQAHLQHITIQF